MKARVVVSTAAVEEYTRLDTWWRTHRGAAQEQVASEIERLIALLAEQPEIGKLHPSRSIKDVRWVPLKKTPYRLFYRFDHDQNLVTFMAIWSSMRKRGPRLRKLYDTKPHAS